jgi:NAD/NADP transhydrogenase beta subunit
VASVCFIQALKGLSSPSSARMGNTFGMAGMAIAVNLHLDKRTILDLLASSMFNTTDSVRTIR